MKGRPDGKSKDQAQGEFLKLVGEGRTVKDALAVVHRAETTYKQWRKDPKFAILADRARLGAKYAGPERVELPFAEFSEKYLFQRVWPHTQNIVDVIEGREPSWLHPSMTFEPAEPDLVMINIAPEHAKTIGVTVNYTVSQIAMNPNIRVIIVSKTRDMAKKMLLAIKTRLTHPRYQPFHLAYGPAEGYDSDSEGWDAQRIYISNQLRDSGEKDPTVEALGIGSHIYGARADLIILDDVVDLSNAHLFEQQIEWIQAELMSRLSSSGRMVAVGTRLASRDLYSEIRDHRRYPDERSPWTYLAMPAVLEYADQPRDWLTLWPLTDQPDAGTRGAKPRPDGLYVKWDGTALARKRAKMDPRLWAMVYQQQQTSDAATFNADDIRGCTNGARYAGLMPKGVPSVREGRGMDGLTCFAGMDPAARGHTAAVAAALDPVTHQRFVLEVHNKPDMRPEAIKQLIKDWIVKYGLTEWRIEKNAFQVFLVEDREINQFAAQHNCLIKPHFTGAQKMDPGFGVAAMAPLFHGWESGENILELPSTQSSEGMKSLIEQLVTWFPGADPKRMKQDTVMALWFTMLAISDRDRRGENRQSHLQNRWLGAQSLAQRRTFSISDYLQEQRAGRI